ncbi:E3 ubiquitin-protein ligase HRD1 [Colletotrichum chlorophyti]|uniref:RING-type E3 ubiquitin transferase n=1 Tax=Colletotrichum chlorophyti TaxID=708187 RepID=A0A1Q8S7K4_9PEZI|nr:E3 ubiquitin-protein ligase HRD1 [Colletotrichum chlorophyti]
MRLAWYAGVSTALAASVVVSAFHQRANFYSAMVYLAQSNFCLLVLVNFIYLIYGTLIYGLQRLLYGPLRQVEVEQLSEKAWFAITETCLAMTIFREEIGAWFLVMFTALVTGKVWGWIGDGRVEVLEQQPPTNPGLFHTRLSISLLLSLVYDTWLLRYTVNTVIQQARPNMMVMFLFEFAVLATCSARTGIRYMVSVMEQNIVKTQTRLRLEERRRQVREEREELIRQREHDGGAAGTDQPDLPREEDIDEMDIEVPGWEAKGQWILILDLVADCVKLAIYLVFFGILLTFYGLPIHIMRDLFMTARSVIKRGSALWRYRKAVEDMNKYPDATQEELGREDTCIICREEMRPWDPNNGAVERVRPKKLPCGHILHFGCLKSWLERQQVCPTCRSPVVVNNNAAPQQNREAVLARMGLGGLGGAAAAPAGQPQPADNAQGAIPAGQPAQPAPRNGAARVFQLGPLRLGFAQGENVQQLAQQMGVPPEAIPTPLAQGPPAGGPFTPAATTPGGNNMPVIRQQIQHLEQMIQREVQALQHMHQEMQTLQLLTVELGRIRQLQQQQEQMQNASPSGGQAPTVVNLGATHQLPLPAMPPLSQVPIHQTWRVNGPVVTRHGAANHSNAIPAGSSELPEGVVIPPGWSLLPLQRLDGAPMPFASQPFPEQGPSTTGEAAQQPDVAAPASEVPAAEGVTQTSGSIPTTTTDFSSRSNEMEQRQETATSSSSAPANQTDSPPVLAPNPVLPNWGGANQLFGGGRVLSGLGNPALSESSVDERQDESASRGSAEKTPSVTTTAPAQEENTEENSGNKGKGKAVTVEEAEDDE